MSENTHGGVIKFEPGEVWLDLETGEFTRIETDSQED